MIASEIVVFPTVDPVPARDLCVVESLDTDRYRVLQSFSVQETSPDAGGLAARYLAKIMIPTGFGLILLQGIALMVTSILQLQGKWAIEEEEEKKEAAL